MEKQQKKQVKNFLLFPSHLFHHFILQVVPFDFFCQKAKEIDWDSLEKAFEPLYGTTGRPLVPIRTIVGLSLLKQMYKLGDETVVERYLENPYWQHFFGEIYFQY